MEAIVILVVLILVAVAGLVAVGILATNLLHICEPNEVLVFSGRFGKDRERGYRVVKGGRGLRIPLIERVDRLDLTNLIIDASISNAYSKGGIPLTIQGVANLKIAGNEPVLDNAIERLLSKPREDVIHIAKDVLEGTLRGVLAQLTPEEVNEDKLRFAQMLHENVQDDLARLGLELDTMKIQNVSDDRGYLNSIGRRKSADILKRSRIAEANARAKAVIRDADNRQRARIREIESEEAIARAEAERRIADAKTRRKALIAESEGEVNAEIARVESGLEAEEARVEETRRRLEADVIEPARAAQEAGIAEAKGNAALILEEGRATVDVLEQMIRVWQEAGPNARDIFLMQKLQTVMSAMLDTIGDVHVERVTMLPSVHDDQDPTRRAMRLVEELKGAFGVDLPEIVNRIGQKPQATESRDTPVATP